MSVTSANRKPVTPTKERRGHSASSSSRGEKRNVSLNAQETLQFGSSILHKGSTGLLSTFINSWTPKYHENLSSYREGGYLTVKLGDVFHNGRYEILHKLGWGEFSTVWLAHDRNAESGAFPFVAIKISKCAPPILASTMYEINLLNYLNQKHEGATLDDTCLVTLLNEFEHTGTYGKHLCMVMPLLGPNVLCVIDQMKSRRHRRTEKEITMIRDAIRATLRGLAQLDKLNMVHTDLKPENILCNTLDSKTLNVIQNCISERRLKGTMPEGSLALPQRKSCVYVADFGLSFLLEPPSTACALARKIGTRNLKVAAPGVAVNTGVLIQTREYRAPEVLFGHNFSPKSDVWSLGCVLYELITGEFLMDPKRRTKVEKEMDIEHVAMMMQLLGPVPVHIATQPGRHISNYFDAEGKFIHAERYRHYNRRSLEAELEPILPPKELSGCVSFIYACFSYDIHSRNSAASLLEHPWLQCPEGAEM